MPIEQELLNKLELPIKFRYESGLVSGSVVTSTLVIMHSSADLAAALRRERAAVVGEHQARHPQHASGQHRGAFIVYTSISTHDNTYRRSTRR